LLDKEVSSVGDFDGLLPELAKGVAHPSLRLSANLSALGQRFRKDVEFSLEQLNQTA
jgi:hypothetical protein